MWKRLRYDPSEELSVEDAQAFQNITNMVPDILQIDDPSKEVDNWIAINATKSNSAPGVGGIRVSELQQMPRDFIRRLCIVISSHPTVLPAHLMQGRTLAMPMVQHCCSAAQVRPITIFPQTFRLWAKTVIMKLLQALARVLPAPIAGFLPGRSAEETACNAQMKLEHWAARNTRSGTTLDLVKCYNVIRRQFAKFLLTLFGCPASVANQWMQAMQNLTRFWEVQGRISEPSNTTTGCAEGDPPAVVVMVAISAVWARN